MNSTTVPANLEVVPAEGPTTFDSLARLVPDDLQAAYYRVLAHTRTLNPDDEMLRILEAMGVLTLLTRHTPKDIADERERFQASLDLHQQCTEEIGRNMLRYLHDLEARIADLPAQIGAGLDPKQIAKMLGESLRQHFQESGVPDLMKALQVTTLVMASAQKELSTALRAISAPEGGVVAQVEYANNRLAYSLESRVRTVDALMHEWKTDLLRIWIPLITGAGMLIGLIGGFEIQGCRDSSPSAAVQPAQTATGTSLTDDSKVAIQSAVKSKKHSPERK